MKDPNNPCIFCSIRKNELIFENSLAYASKDSYPVAKFHSLVVPKRCVKNYFELNLSLIHISEPTRLLSISYAVFCLKKKKK